MKNKMIKVSTVVPRLKIGDIKFNTSQIIDTIKAHKDSGVIVFPELSITGYTCQDLFLQSALLDETENALIEIKEETKVLNGVTVVVGAPLRFENSLYNCAIVINEGRILGVVPKINLPNYGEFYELRWFTSGKNIQNQNIKIGIEEVPFGTNLLFEDQKNEAILGLEICEDLWVPDKPSTHMAFSGANIIANLSASNEVIGKKEYRRNMVKSQSEVLECAYLYTSSGMGESSTDLVFSGHSIISSNGHVLNEGIFETENKVYSAIIDIEKIKNKRLQKNTFGNVQNHYQKLPVSIKSLGGEYKISTDRLKEILLKENYKIEKLPFVPNDENLFERTRDILNIQAHGIVTRVKATGIKNLIIGVSGGLDSTLALIACYEAKKIYPDINIIGYTMPSKGNTTSLTYQNARNLMKSLDVEINEVEIGKGVEAHLKDIGHPGVYSGESDITYENAQARMRTYILMDAANLKNGLVIGTGDLSELALGWCTYNGDQMSMYGVNGSIPKTLVKYLCLTYAKNQENQTLKETIFSICDTPISPELRPHDDSGKITQMTEEKIGKYDLNDFFLYHLLKYGFEPEKILSFAMVAYNNLSKDEIKEALVRFYQRFFTQQFKRSCLPDGPKVGSLSLSPRGDWKMPSDISAKLWIDQVKNA